MSPGSFLVFPGVVTSATAPRLRVALAATPLLLAESLRSLLPSEADVTVVLDRPVRARFDVAIVTGNPEDVDAETVIRLDDDPASRGGGIVLFADGRSEVRLDDLAELLSFLEEAVVARRHIRCG
jgi:hypothetical protein